MESNDIIMYIIIGIIVLLVVFLLLREISCWYWKINERISLQQKTNVLLDKIASKLGTSNNEEKKSTITDEKIDSLNISQSDKDFLKKMNG